MKLEFHPQAELELIEAAEYYESLVPGLGFRLQAEVHRASKAGGPDTGNRAVVRDDVQQNTSR